MNTQFDFKKCAIEVEKVVAAYVGNEVDALNKINGYKMAADLMLTVAGMFAARAVVNVHVWTGVSLETCGSQFNDALNDNINTMLQKWRASLSNGETR